MAINPSTTTLNSLMSMLPAGLLGLDTSDPAGAMASQIMLNWLKTNMIQPMTGIAPSDPLWNATLWTNMTDFGVMMQGMNSQANSIGMQNMIQQQASARYQFLEGWQRTATSLESFNQLKAAGKTGGFNDYDSFIQHKTQGMMDNPILNMAMQMGIWDPTGQMMASAHLRDASANIAREAMWRGDRAFQEKADAVGKIFLKDRLEVNYDKRDYGQMTMNESAAVLAALTKNRSLEDLAPGAKDMEDATNKLRERLQGLTQAMSPLKDFFGDDVPNMIHFLEELSGKSFGQLDNGTIRNLTTRVTNSLSTGIYTADQLSAVTKSLNQTLGQMDTGFYMDPASLTIAETMLGTVNAGLTPRLMNDNTFRQAVSERTIRHAASPFANSINLAYANWWQNERERNPEADVSFGTFQQRYRELRDGERGLTAEAAMLELSGATSVAQMFDRGYRSLGYSEAVTNGLGASMANNEATRERVATFIAGLGSGEDQKAMQAIYEKLVTNRAEGMTTEGVIKQWEEWGTSATATAEQKQEAAVWNMINQNKKFQALAVDLRTMGSQVDIERKTTNADLLRKRTEFINDVFQTGNASDAMELLRNVILTEKGENPEAGIADKLNAIREKAQITNLADTVGLIDQDMKNIETLQGIYGEDEDVLAKDAMRMYLLDVGPNGKNRNDLQPYFEAVQKNGNDEKAKTALRYAMTTSADILKLYAEQDKQSGATAGSAYQAAVNALSKSYEGDREDKAALGAHIMQGLLKNSYEMTYKYGSKAKTYQSHLDEARKAVARAAGDTQAAEWAKIGENIVANGGDFSEFEKEYGGQIGAKEFIQAYGKVRNEVEADKPNSAQSAGAADINQTLTQLLGDGSVLSKLSTAIDGLTSWLRTTFGAGGSDIPNGGSGEGGTNK